MPLKNGFHSNGQGANTLTCRVQCSRILSILWTRACGGTISSDQSAACAHHCTEVTCFTPFHIFALVCGQAMYNVKIIKVSLGMSRTESI